MSNYQNNLPAVDEVSWDDASINPTAPTTPQRKMERFKGEQNEKYRMLIIDQPVRVYQHYKQGFGYLRCLRSVNQRCAFCEGGDKAAEKYAVNVLMYPKGVQVPTEITPHNVKVVVWLFNAKVFAELRAIKSEWGPLDTYDLKVECTNAQFQHLTITPAREALWKQAPNAAGVEASVKAQMYDLKRTFSRTQSEAEVAGIFAGTLGRDDIFKKGGASGAPRANPVAPPVQPTTPAQVQAVMETLTTKAEPAVPATLDWNALLGRN